MVRRGSTNAQRAPDRIDGESSDLDGGVEHGAQDDLGLALAVQALFAQFEKASGDDRKQELATKICTELSIHAQIEEEIFYPACEGKVEEDLLKEAYVEHDGAKVLIAEIMAGKPSDEFYDAKVKVLQEQIEHHVQEEEKRLEGLFSQARAAGLDMDALGEELRTRKEQLKAEIEANGLPAPQLKTMEETSL